MVDIFLEAHRRAPRQIILDFDATDDPIHGKQEGRFFHGYYGNYCYLPLYIFCGEFLLGARLRSSDIDASEGALEELKRIIAQIPAEVAVRGHSHPVRIRVSAVTRFSVGVRAMVSITLWAWRRMIG